MAGDQEKVEALHALVLRSLDDDQAVEVVTIPLTGKSNIADHMVIASGRSTRQVASMAQKLTERIKQELGRNVRIEGLPIADWVLIDAEDVIVHLFRPEVRSFYNLERMWAFEGDGGAVAAPAAG
ncbi:MAG TPA: ribosome silencing factor [Allosphingosinicella sp.]|jgi:ribosome-associated protein|nr:ribosome silencing factor [Allosphingosinicella sp.]